MLFLIFTSNFKFQSDSINTMYTEWAKWWNTTLNSNLILLILAIRDWKNVRRVHFKFQSDSINTVSLPAPVYFFKTL